MKPRHQLLGTVLLATLAATFWPQSDVDDDAAATEDRVVVRERSRPLSKASTKADPALPATTANQPKTEISTDRPRFALSMAGDLFPEQNWNPPAPPPPPLLKRPPEAPPMPFKYLGRWIESGTEYVFLTHGNRAIRIVGSETLPGGWHVDAIDERAVYFTYKPLNQQQILGIAP